MIVKITAQWSATSFFDAGERQFETDWKNHPIPPIAGNVLRISSFIESPVKPSETFTYNGKQTNVFQFIENEQQWIIQQVELERKGTALIGHVLVTDSGLVDTRNRGFN